MPNKFYTRVYSPLPEQRVSSQVLKDEFARVEAGFDVVQGDANRAIKLPVGTADQTLALSPVQRANLLMAFDASGNISAVVGGGRFRGDWTTATAYVVSDYFRDPASKNIYSVVAAHTSGVLATDISAGRVQLAINVEDVEAAKTAAQNAATTATTQAGVATTQAGTATTQAGVATTQASTATTQAGVATTQAGIATGAAATATTQAGIATTKAAEAAASAASIAGGPVPEAPSDGKAYARKDASWVVDLGAGIPALAGQALKNLRVKSDETGVEWVGAPVSNIDRTAKTSAYTLAAADKGALIDCSGTWTLGFTAAATLGAGWWCYVRNVGTGDITLDPNSTETIDGLTSFVLYPGAVRLVLCDGTALRSIPLVGGTKTFTTTGSYVWAPGIQQWDADLMAGGAGGGGGALAATRYNGGGGGAGERLLKKIVKSEIVVGGATTCTVGAKGLGGAAASANDTPANGFVNPGTSGGDSSIGTLAVAYAGKSTGSGGYTSAHGNGGAGGGQSSLSPYLHPASQAYFPGQASNTAVSPGGVYPVTEWGGPSGRAGDSSAAALTATLGCQRGGRSGAAVAAGAAGANGVNPGDGGDGGAGNLNGSPAGKGGDGADGKITIVEVI